MAKSVFTDAYQSALQALVALRREAGVTQVELARRLGKPQQFVSRYELGVRRLDIVEFWVIARALETDPGAAFARVTSSFPDDVAI